MIIIPSYYIKDLCCCCEAPVMDSSGNSKKRKVIAKRRSLSSYDKKGGIVLGHGVFGCVIAVKTTIQQQEANRYPPFIALKIQPYDTTKSLEVLSPEQDFIIAKILSDVTSVVVARTRNSSSSEWKGLNDNSFSQNPFVVKIYNTYWVSIADYESLEPELDDFIPSNKCEKIKNDITFMMEEVKKQVQTNNSSEFYRLYVLEMEMTNQPNLSDYLQSALELGRKSHYLFNDRIGDLYLSYDYFIRKVLTQIAINLYDLSINFGLVHRDLKATNLLLHKVDRFCKYVYQTNLHNSSRSWTIKLGPAPDIASEETSFEYVVKLTDFGLSTLNEDILSEYNFRKNPFESANTLFSPINHLIIKDSEINLKTCDVWAFGILAITLSLYGWDMKQFENVLSAEEEEEEEFTNNSSDGYDDKLHNNNDDTKSKKRKSEYLPSRPKNEFIYDHRYESICTILMKNTRMLIMARRIIAELKLRDRDYILNEDESILPSEASVIGLITILQFVYFLDLHLTKRDQVYKRRLPNLSAITNVGAIWLEQNYIQSTPLFDIINEKWFEILEICSDQRGSYFFDFAVLKILERTEENYLKMIYFCLNLTQREAMHKEQHHLFLYIIDKYLIVNDES